MRNYGVRLNVTRSLYDSMFKRYVGRYDGFQIFVTEANDDPFGPIADYYKVVVKDPETDTSYPIIHCKRKPKSKEEAIEQAVQFIKGLKVGV